ncbi:TetR family transcriptional regulator [Actinomadura geliboluensis]|uniref:TetR family transcriptional regulator n=1 Tax=Actinomadura geliboluensis TaxID=882440 RepID=A0A5S4HAN3_9ACTN|nr:TetR family transcriptional regulator [Actinomadura geliboluensis]
MGAVTDTTKRPRRAPAPDERTLDADRSRRLLLDAALDEFAAKGYAGARVQDIADRAGLNKQLINYYFGGKAGLYRELLALWGTRKGEINDPSLPMEEVAVGYLRHILDDPRGTRLSAWRGLDAADGASDPGDDPCGLAEDLSDVERRQEAGELAGDLDPAAVRLVLMAMTAAPVTMPHAVRRVFGLDPRSPEFRERYAEQLRRIVRHLAGP